MDFTKREKIVFGGLLIGYAGYVVYSRNPRIVHVNIAKKVAGLQGNDTDYLSLIGPNETFNRQVEMAQMSGCALTAAGIWRRSGVKHPILDGQYQTGTAVSRLITIAKDSGAWQPYTPGVFPKAGDVVLIGDNAGGGIEHIYTIINVVSPGVYDTVDGGQMIGNLQAVKIKNHRWNGKMDGSRVIQGFVDITKLPHKFWI